VGTLQLWYFPGIIPKKVYLVDIKTVQ